MCGTPAGGGAAVCYASNRTEGLDRYGRVAYTEFKLGNNLYNRQSFSGNLGRLASSTVGTTPVGADRLSRSYTYDAIGNINTIVDPLASQTHTYGYDHLDRLTAWSVTGSNPTSESYSYDTIGNITAKTGIAGGYTYPAAGQARPHAPTAVGGQSYSYDANGNLTSGGGRTLTWDYDNKPASVTPAGGSIFTAESYQYGPDGERIKKTVGNVTTYYFGLLEEEVNSGTGVTTRRLQYKWGGSVIAQREKVGTGVETVVYLAGDHLGSVSVATNASGGYVNPGSSQQLFDPWGKVRTGTLTSTTTLNYTGQKLDATGLLFYNARYYDPNIAKFISPDSIVPDDKKPTNFNRYSYVLNNPLRYVDPSGYCAKKEGGAGARDDENDKDCWAEYDAAKAANGGTLPAGIDDLNLETLQKLTKWLSRGIQIGATAKASWSKRIVDIMIEALTRVENYLGKLFDSVMGIGDYGTLRIWLADSDDDREVLNTDARFDGAVDAGKKKFNNLIRFNFFEYSTNGGKGENERLEDLIEVTIHEIGHLADYTYGKSPFNQNAAWQEAHRGTGAVNDNARNAAHEDYAETFTWLVESSGGRDTSRATRGIPSNARQLAVVGSLWGRDPKWPSK
jgi:RHS repeat-associated protein